MIIHVIVLGVLTLAVILKWVTAINKRIKK
jgi:hypothetical protein